MFQIPERSLTDCAKDLYEIAKKRMLKRDEKEVYSPSFFILFLFQKKKKKKKRKN